MTRRPLHLLERLRGRNANERVPIIQTMYGPSAIGATLGNGGLSVGVTATGTVSVLRWPSPSFHDHLRHLTTSIRAPLWGAREDEGILTGVVWARGDDRRLTWLRDAERVEQRYLDDACDVVVTTHHLDEAGLTVTVTDDVGRDLDVLTRRHAVTAQRADAAEAVALVAFASVHPTVRHLPLLPVWDVYLDAWHAARAEVDAQRGALVWHAARATPWTRRRPPVAGASTAVVVGWDGPADDPAVDADLGPAPRSWRRSAEATPWSLLSAAGPHTAGRHAGRQGLVDGAVATPLRDGQATLVVAVGPDVGTAARTFDAGRRRPHADAVARTRRWWQRWLADAALPDTDEPDVAAHARRTLVSLAQATDRVSAAIVASIATQPPYAVDWIRDGAYLNEALHAAGHPELVARHNRFYAQTIVRRGQRPPGSWLTPRGSWPMNLYADGTAGGPIPFEIDETGLGAWTLVRHWDLTGDDAYLADVYPAVAAAADFLTRWRDPATGLPRPAFEDDHPMPERPATLVSASPAWQALRAAARAAAALGRADDARRWGARADELDGAIERFAHPDEPLAWGSAFGGDHLVWPARFRPFDHPRVQAQAEVSWRRIAPSFDAPQGDRVRYQYEARTLLTLAHVWAETDPARLEDVRRGLRWLARHDVTDGTGLTGEAWYVDGGRVRTAVAPPHVWNMSLWYLAALVAWPPR